MSSNSIGVEICSCTCNLVQSSESLCVVGPTSRLTLLKRLYTLDGVGEMVRTVAPYSGGEMVRGDGLHEACICVDVVGGL